jgi:hypothetical protein
MPIDDHLPKGFTEFYEVHNYRNALELLTNNNEFKEIVQALMELRITLDDIRKPGGNESSIPKKVSALLRPLKWYETKVRADLTVTSIGKLSSKGKKEVDDDDDEPDELEEITTEKTDELKNKGFVIKEKELKNFIDGHKVDYVKERLAFDLEWNSKDQTFDRDLYAMRAFYECNLIDAGILLTRSKELNPIFDKLGQEIDKEGKPKFHKDGKTPKLLKSKYGASTTWMGKLTYRIDAGRGGGCPILALGIRPALISDLETLEEQDVKKM